jgi:hypothetical protein
MEYNIEDWSRVEQVYIAVFDQGEKNSIHEIDIYLTK